MGYGGANRALWGHINGSPGANWGKVHAILKNKETREARSSSSMLQPSGSSFPVYQSRQTYKEGEHDKCLRCNKSLSAHTPVKKWCPKY